MEARWVGAERALFVVIDPSESGLSVDFVEQSLPPSAFRANSLKFEPRHRWAAKSHLSPMPQA